MKIINSEKKKVMITLTKEENKSHKEHEACHIYVKKR